VRIAKLMYSILFVVLLAFLASACKTGGTADAKDSMVAATVNGKNIMLAQVERTISQQSGGKQSQLSQLELAQARLQVLGSLIQREVLFQRAEREKLLPTDDQVNSMIQQQKQQSGMTDDDFQRNLREQNLSMEAVREEARKDVAIRNLQDKYSGKIAISDREVEEFYNSNKDRFVNARGVLLAMIMVDPADNSPQGILQDNDAKDEARAKLKIDDINQQLKAGADFATVARAKSEDANSLVRGGDLGAYATEDDLKQNGFPPELVTKLFAMQVGDRTEPVRFNSGKWYIFKLADKRSQTENLTLESPGVRQQITQALTNQRKEILNAALLETAMNEAKVVNILATNMLTNPSNLGLRPASPAAATSPAATQAPASAASPAANANNSTSK
jgi:peptidyl-prolyl cis-trans isomerase SurA